MVKWFILICRWWRRFPFFQYADLKQVKFIIGLGDNFYYEGVKTVEDHRFTTTFEHVYTNPALRAATWYMIAGNHDHASNVSAQIAYTKVSPRWHFPDFFYSKGKKNLKMVIAKHSGWLTYRRGHLIGCSTVCENRTRKQSNGNTSGDMSRAIFRYTHFLCELSQLEFL